MLLIARPAQALRQLTALNVCLATSLSLPLNNVSGLVIQAGSAIQPPALVTFATNHALFVSHLGLTAMPVPLTTTLLLLLFLLRAISVMLLVTNALDLATPIVKPVNLLTSQLTSTLQRVWLSAPTLDPTSSRMEASAKSALLSVALAQALQTPTAIPAKQTTSKL